MRSFIFILLFLNSAALALCPDARIVLDETAEYCENCREHGMDGWIVRFRLENLSSWPIYALGFGLWNEMEDRTRNPERFFIDAYRQRRRFGSLKWLSENGTEIPDWVKNKLFVKDDRQVIQQLGFYEWESGISWNFEIKDMIRYNIFVGFEDNKEPCTISSNPFFLRRSECYESAKIVLVKNSVER